MGKIFISYRRSDSHDATGRIHDHLALFFGSNAIFRDLDSIPGGSPFDKELYAALKNCTILLAIIGTGWLSAEKDGQRRLDRPDDRVRIEIADALSRNVPVIPIRLTSARLPEPQELPDCLRELVSNEVMDMRSGKDFIGDIRKLCARIGELTGLPGIDYDALMTDCRRIGLLRAVGHFEEDTSSNVAITDAKHLIVVMNDGRSWINAKRELLRKRIKDKNRTTHIVLIHPKSDFLKILVRKNGKSEARQADEIRSSVRVIKEGANGVHVSVMGHFGFNPATLILTEAVAFWSPYHFMEAGALPQFKFDAAALDGMYHRLKSDVDELIAASEPLTEAALE